MRTLALLLGMAALAFAQDPNRNRMNDPTPANPVVREGVLPMYWMPYENRMNARFGEARAGDLTGAPPPNRNRMNAVYPAAAAPAPAKIELLPLDPLPRP
jgi:hypothetical protein